MRFELRVDRLDAKPMEFDYAHDMFVVRDWYSMQGRATWWRDTTHD